MFGWFRMHSVLTISIFPHLTLTNVTQFANPHLTCVTSSSRISILETSEFFSELPVYPSLMPLSESEALPTTLLGSEPIFDGPLLTSSMFPTERNIVQAVLSFFTQPLLLVANNRSPYLSNFSGI